LTKITSKGQIWLPVEIKEFLDVSDGDFIYFVLDKINKSVWLSNVDSESSRLSRNKSVLTVKFDNLKGSDLKLKVVKEYMKNTNIVINEEDSKEYENVFSALNINVRKI